MVRAFLFLTISLFSINFSLAVDCATEDFSMGTERLNVMINGKKVHDLWNEEQAQNLSFCIDGVFNDEYEKLELVTREAAIEWMTHANVDFKLVDDLNCARQNRPVAFKIKKAPRRAKYNAKAFFPSYPKEKHLIMVRKKKVRESSHREIKRVMIHELGHVLGFRHEHISPEAGDLCPPENEPFEAITEYDPLSIMHYQQCSSFKIKNYVLSDLDKEGARLAYPE